MRPGNVEQVWINLNDAVSTTTVALEKFSEALEGE